MKKAITTVLIGLISLTLIKAQNASYSFIFNEVKFSENSEFQPGSGRVVIYDNASISFSGASNSGKSFNYSFSFHSLSSWLDGSMFRVCSGNCKDGDNAPNITLGIGGSMVFYTDELSGVNISMYDGAKMNEHIMEECVNALNNHTGPFRSFISEAETELPPAIEGYTTTRNVQFPAAGGRECYSVRTKTGKLIYDTKWKDYKVSSDANWCEVKYKTGAAFCIVADANTTGSSRSSLITVTVGDKATQMKVTQPSLTAKILNVWVEHNKFSGLVKGMRIHVKFETYNVRGYNGECAAYFYFSDGTKLKDYNYQYSSVDGQVSVGGSFSPNYDSAIFNDYVLFMPYSELHISGSAQCKFHVDVRIGGEVVQSEEVFFTFN